MTQEIYTLVPIGLAFIIRRVRRKEVDGIPTIACGAERSEIEFMDRSGGEPTDFTIESMTPADWVAVRAIYVEGIATRSATFEADAPDWESWDRGRRGDCRLVARSEGLVVGWAALSPVSSRPAYAGVAEVSLYVAATARGRGIGTALLRALIEESERAGIWTLQGANFPENAASLALVRRGGFREVGRRERIGCLDGIWRDTILVEHRSRVVGV